MLELFAILSAFFDFNQSRKSSKVKWQEGLSFPRSNYKQFIYNRIMSNMSWVTFLIRLPLILLVGFIVVPQHLLLLYFILLRASFIYFGSLHTFLIIACYGCWMKLTNHLKFKAGHIGPDYVAVFIQWALKLYLDRYILLPIFKIVHLTEKPDTRSL